MDLRWLRGIAVFAATFTLHPAEAFAFACNNNFYVNASGNLIHSPSCGKEHIKPMADCRDGSVSFSEHHSGTCSHHGGVAHWD
jgi:predicted RNA-binding Zn-ribbon protein involved in translation (DUF1610 family)